MMTNEMGTTDKLTVVLNEARAMGVEVLPPDVNDGEAFFWPSSSRGSRRESAQIASAGDQSRLTPAATVEKGAIRFGLAAIKGVGEVAVEAIIKARAEGGKFESLVNFCERVDTRTVTRKTIEALIKCGACDSFGSPRKAMFHSLDLVLSGTANTADIRTGDQGGFDSILSESRPVERLMETFSDEWPQHELLAHEKELLGFYVTGHPMTPFAPLLEKYCLHNTVTAKTLAPRTLTRIGGMIGAVQQGFSKKSGKPYAMVTIEDLEGTASMLLMNENYDKYRELLVQGKALLIVGEVNNDEDRPKIFPQEIMPLEEAPRKYTRQVHFRLNTANLTPETLQAARSLCEANPGRVPTFLCLRKPGGELIFIETHENYSVTPTQQLQQAVDEVFGEDTYYAKVDTSLPERQKRVWEKKSDNGDE
jgi:DNA polymerase-3 subunit alpha